MLGFLKKRFSNKSAQSGLNGQAGQAAQRAHGFDYRWVFVFAVISALTAFIFVPGGGGVSGFGTVGSVGEPALKEVVSTVDLDVDGLTVKKGEVVVSFGELLTELSVAKVELVEARAVRRGAIRTSLGIFVLTLLLTSLSCIFSVGKLKRFTLKSKDLIFMAAVFSGAVLCIGFSTAASRALLDSVSFFPPEFYIYAVPVAIGPMLIMLFLRPESTFLFSALLAIVAGYLFGSTGSGGSSIDVTAYFFVGSLAAAIGVRYCTQRATVLKAGLGLGLVNIVMLLAISAVRGDTGGTWYLSMVIAGLINGVTTAVITVGIAPIFESLFQYTTDIRLLELSRTDNPLLKKLAEESPGTYHHSIVMGSLVEAAAEAIDANPLLARVAAYYHDIGKTKKSDYFIENMQGENKHDNLAPSMSALIIANHVKEGVEMARAARLGPDITAIIQEHHGTSLIKFFYEKARRDAEAGPESSGGASVGATGVAVSGATVDERDYRYPGPKPQTREAGLVMLADAIEAASKTVPDPTPDKIKGMTQKIVNRFFTDGQLDECELTLKDLHLITGSFNRVFTGIFHQRVSYAEPAYITKKEDGDDGPDRRDDEDGGKGAGQEDRREGLKRLGMR